MRLITEFIITLLGNIEKDSTEILLNLSIYTSIASLFSMNK